MMIKVLTEIGNIVGDCEESQFSWAKLSTAIKVDTLYFNFNPKVQGIFKTNKQRTDS